MGLDGKNFKMAKSGLNEANKDKSTFDTQPVGWTGKDFENNGSHGAIKRRAEKLKAGERKGY